MADKKDAPSCVPEKELTEPRQILREFAERWQVSDMSEEFATLMDARDPEKSLREEFHYPKKKTLPGVDLELCDGEEDAVYLCGNSLGLQPKATSSLIQDELDKWKDIGVHGHVKGDRPWVYIDETVDEDMAKLVGAKRTEVALMNGLTVNQHLLLISFYRPTPNRHKILLEARAFPSDHYTVQSQIALHGYDPKTSMLLVQPREGEELLRAEDILDVLETEGESIALVMLPGVQYYTGQVLDMETITAKAHKQGCYVGFDLAHAVGNINIRLHDWGVDFAVWCTYKYLNSGAGGVGGAFLHENLAKRDLPRLMGWWGHQSDTRFRMDNNLIPTEGIRGYRLSNPSMFTCTALRASLNVFNKTSMTSLRHKSYLLTGYLEMLLERHLAPSEQCAHWVKVLSPRDPSQRGCQLSITVSAPAREVCNELNRRGVVVDVREPDVLRVAPTALYNSFLDVHRFVQSLGESLATLANGRDPGQH